MKQMERGILSSYDFKRTSTKIGYAIMVLMLVGMAFTMLYPIAVTMLNGFKTNAEVNSFPPKFLPTTWEFDNFSKGWNYIDLTVFLKNTLFIFIGNMVVTVFVLGLASYSLSRLRVPYQRYIQFFFMVTLFIPAASYMIPSFVNLKELGLLNSYAAFWLPAGANAFFLLLLKSFFDGVHMELLEAARIDGASEVGTFVRIALPLSIPIFATLAIFVFSTAWNDWFWPSLVMHSEDKYPLATAMYKYVINVRRLDTNIKFAILFMVMVPPIIVFLVFQKYIMRGLHLGGVKG
ncbi:carbohydrate ABC transporter permease [Paenibacillus guangzhouensis]|uniref:carbohydrate ABC transporter permease n=1 Tax=Paenibacillus guangzhouensis TaxID=1473112 RepID=UPI0012670BAC|nr:carbohydrate ABC transporter permease [Paenibacillus guangzhouensis]